MNRNRAVLAAAAAALFTAGLAGQASAEHHEKGEGKKVHCEGVNSCKGHSECQTASNDCKGLNSCKGKGWVSMSDEQCDKAKAALKGS